MPWRSTVACSSLPGNRPERFQKAALSGAGAMILDLEDAVPPADQASAREAIRQQWPQLLALDVPLVVRINAADSAAWAADLAALAGLQRLAVMVPKAESAEALRQAHEVLSGVAVLPLVESATGYDALHPHRRHTGRAAARAGPYRLHGRHRPAMQR